MDVNLTYNNKGLYLWVLVAISIILFVFSCQNYRDKQYIAKEKENIVNYLNDSVTYYKNRNKQNVATKLSLKGEKESLEVLLSQQKDKNQQLKSLVDKYKTINSAGTITQVTKIDTIFIPFEKPVDFSFNKYFQVDDPHYFLSGNVNSKGVQVNQLFLEDSLSFVIGERKNGFFRRRTFSIDAVNSNPNVTITGLDSYSYNPKPKRWGVGVHAGYNAITNNIAISFGIQYNLIQF